MPAAPPRSVFAPKKPKVGDAAYATQAAQVPAQDNVPGKDLPDPTSGTQVSPDTPSVVPDNPASGSFDRSAFGDAWAHLSGHSPQDLTNLISQHPEFATGIQRNSPDKVTFPNGEQMDLIGDAGGANTWGWSGYGPSAGGGPSTGSGGNSQAKTGAPAYGPPQSAMIGANGTIPPGIPFNPAQPTFTHTQVAPPPAYQPAAQAPPTASPFADLHNQQNTLINQLMANPTYDQNWINQQNEAQKELILRRQQEASRVAGASAAHRGVDQGGAAAATQGRIANDATNQLLQSNRDINLQAAANNRTGQLNALQAGAAIAEPQEARAQQMDQFLRSLNSQEGQFGATLGNNQYQFGTNLASNENQFGAGLANQNWQFGQNFGEGQRQFDTSQANQMQQFIQNLMQRQNEFGQNMSFNRDNANAGFEQQYINSILNGGY